MEDNSKMNRRSRPRPYDLRRKVLLKNFLREQMTYIPHTRLISAVQNTVANFSVESSNTMELDDLQDLNDENSSSSVSVDNSSSTAIIEENNLDPDIKGVENAINIVDSSTNVKTTEVPVPETKMFKFSSLMNLRSDAKKKKAKGILKAKKVCKSVKIPAKSKSFKTGLERLFSGRSRTSNDKSSDRITRSSTKSLFSLFKSRKEQRKVKEIERTTTHSSDTNVKLSSSESDRNCMSNRSVQTDNSWTREELSRVEHSNKLLREENRLLSESLSYFMSSNSIDSQINHYNSPLQSSNRNMNDSRRNSVCYDNISTCSSYGYDNWNPRSRILRSKSVQEHSDRTNVSRYRHRTRSMNYHNNRSEFYAGPMPSSYNSSQVQEYTIPRVRKKNILASLPVNSTGRVVQRRSSMPERILSENDRSRVCRRTGSVRHSRTSFHSLPPEAFY